MNIQAPPNLSPGVYPRLIGAGHQRLGRRLAGHAGPRQSRGAVAGDRRAGASAPPRWASCWCSACRSIPPMRATPDALARAGDRHAGAAHERRRGLGARRRLGAGQHRAAAARRRCWRARSIPTIERIVDARRPAQRLDRSRDRAAVRGARRRLPPRHRRGRCAAPGGQRRRRALRRQPQHQLHQHLLLSAAVLRLLQGQDARGRCAARPTTSRSTKSSRRAARRGSAARPRCACRAASIPTTPARPISAICRAIKAAVPDMHIHAFSPLEVTQGAATLGLSLRVVPGRAEGRRAGHAAGHRGRDPRRRGARHHLPRQGQHGAMARCRSATAHGLGLRTTSTIMYGHVETPLVLGAASAGAARPAGGDRRLHRIRAAALRAHGSADVSARATRATDRPCARRC